MKLLARRVRTLFWTLQSLFSRYKRLVIGSFLLGLTVFVFIWQLYPYFKNFLPTNRYVIGIIGMYEPGNLPIKVQKLISFGLTDISENGEAIPLIAESWESDQDGTRYFFHLKPDIFWHDGKEFTAYDVNYNFKDVLITAADRKTLKIELKEPFSPLPTLLSKPLFKAGLVGLGEYKVSSIKLKEDKIERLVLKPVVKDSNKPIIEYRFYPDTETAVTAFKLGEMDVLEGMFLKDYFKDEKNVKITEEPVYDLILTLFFNQQKDIFKTKEVRQALSYATPTFEGKEVFSPISENSWAYNGQIKQYKYNIDLAKSLLDGGAIASSSGIILSTFPEYLDSAEKISNSWNDMGVETHVRVVHVLPSDYDAFLGMQEIPSDPDQYSLWHSTQQNTNITHYSNPKIDKLLEDGRKTTDKDGRLKIYWDFQRYLAEDAPAKFIVNPILYTISRK